MMYLFITLIAVISGFMIGKNTTQKGMVEVKDTYTNPNELKGRRLEMACAVKLANEIVQSGAMTIERKGEEYSVRLKVKK